MQEDMKQITIGVFHDDSLAKELGKKATESDMVFFHRKTDDAVFSFVCPIDDKITVKSQVMNISDVAIVSAESITPALGETILMLDSLNMNRGLCVVPAYVDTDQLQNMMKDTTLESFDIIEKNIHHIMEYLTKQDLNRNLDAPVVITIDHSFPVKGVGDVLLGFVNKGIVHKHEKLKLLPLEKEVIVRSIQMQDNEVNEAPAGSRVGLAVRGANYDELKRGHVLCSPDAAQMDTAFTLSFSKNPFYQLITPGMFHATIGLQTIPIQITDISSEMISFSTEKPVCYTKGQSVLILDLNASKLRHMGTAIIK